MAVDTTARDKLLAEINAEANARTPASEQMYRRAAASLSGGVSSGGKFRLPYPIYAKDAEGAYITDLDGNRYLDFRLTAGACLLGHRHPVVVEALRHQLDHGSILPGMATETEVELAERISAAVPAMEQIRFANSASEASMIAMRAARAYTGRTKIAKFEGHYIGQHDAALMSGFRRYEGTAERPLPAAEGAGIPDSVREQTVMLPTRNPDAVFQILDKTLDDVALVIYEPVKETWFGGPLPGFLEALRDKVRAAGALLMFDEAVSGLRFAGTGGAQVLYGVTPDLALGGKATGGSVNLGTVGGRADIMDAVVRPVARLAETGETDDWRERIFASGTFTGNPLATAAGVATMRELTDNSPYGRIDGFATQVRDGLNAIIKDTGLPMHVTGVSSIVNIHFAPGPLRNMRDTARADVKLMEAYENALLAEGIWIIAQQAFISTVHTQEHIDRWLEVSDSVLRRVAPAWT